MRSTALLAIAISACSFLAACGEEGKKRDGKADPCPEGQRDWGTSAQPAADLTLPAAPGMKTRPQILADILRKVAAARRHEQDVIITAVTFARVVTAIGVHLTTQNVETIGSKDCNAARYLEIRDAAEAAATEDHWKALATKLEQAHKRSD